MNMRSFGKFATCFAALACLVGAESTRGASQAVSFIGQTEDQTDFQALGFGQAGYYFAQFDAGSPVTEKAPQDNMRIDLPSWASIQFDISQPDRSFSPDAGYFSGDVNDPLDTMAPFGDPVVFGVYSKGGQPTWDTLTLPSGETGLSGSLVDEHTANNSNNSVNRIALGPGVPSSFLLRIVMDNTNGEHDSVERLNPRGASNVDASVDVGVDLRGLTFNGTTDVYTFRYDNFTANDFIKIRFNSGVVGEAAGFGGIMFDVIPEPTTISLVATLLGGLLFCRGNRKLGS